MRSIGKPVGGDMLLLGMQAVVGEPGRVGAHGLAPNGGVHYYVATAEERPRLSLPLVNRHGASAVN